MQSAHTLVVAIKPAIPIIGSPTKQPWRKFAEAFLFVAVAFAKTAATQQQPKPANRRHYCFCLV